MFTPSVPKIPCLRDEEPSVVLVSNPAQLWLLTCPGETVVDDAQDQNDGEEELG